MHPDPLVYQLQEVNDKASGSESYFFLKLFVVLPEKSELEGDVEGEVGEVVYLCQNEVQVLALLLGNIESVQVGANEETCLHLLGVLQLYLG